MPFEYTLEPNKIYGALYHLVAMYSVKISKLSTAESSIDLTSPKSHNLESHD